MATRIGINGFGRIGRQVLRAALERYPEKLNVVAVNKRSGSPAENARLFKYDSTYGRYPGVVEPTNDGITIDGSEVKILKEPEPSRIPWREFDVEIVVESTGVFTDAGRAGGHLEAGAKKVIISAPAKGEDFTVVLGVNQHDYDPERHDILSNASCTTNCAATMVKALHESFGIQRGLLTTIHSYTNDQQLLDKSHSDPRRARSAALNIIPTTTGAAKAVGSVIPELKGKIHGMAMRVPTPTVSVTDLVATLERPASASEINEMYRHASDESLKGILDYTEDPLVSSDFRKDPHSVIIDGMSTISQDGDMVKVVGWYDNEWGYSCRTADLAALVAGAGV